MAKLWDINHKNYRKIHSVDLLTQWNLSIVPEIHWVAGNSPGNEIAHRLCQLEDIDEAILVFKLSILPHKRSSKVSLFDTLLKALQKMITILIGTFVLP